MPPFKIVGGTPVIYDAQFMPSGYTSGTVNKITITARKETLVTTFVWFRCSFRIFDIKIDAPIDANIIRDIQPNTSNLTNAELK